MQALLADTSMAWLGMPAWIWAGFLLVVGVLLAFDLGILHRKPHEISVAESMRMSALFISLGLGFSLVVGWLYSNMPPDHMLDPAIADHTTASARGWAAVSLYLTGYLIEQTLSLDNIFVISLIFTYFAVPRIYQHRVLFWGIIGVIVLRAVMIGAGAAILKEFHWVLYVFGVFLIVTGIKMLLITDKDPDIAGNPILKFLRRHMRVTPNIENEHFFVHKLEPGSGKLVRYATPLFLCLCLIEFADLVFAVDSIPAIFAITQEPFIVYTSNIFAVIGLRSLYFTLAAMVHRFEYLKQALALVLVFIGSKIFLSPFIGKFPHELSLGITVMLLGGGIVYSLWKTRQTRINSHHPAE